MLDAFVFEPFSINQSLLDSFLLENDGFEVYVASSSGTAPLSGSGSMSDPYIVSSSSAVDFDNLMATFGPYTTIHLAPGTYVSQGHSDDATTGWSPRPGQRIIGAGVDITLIQLAVTSPASGKAYFVIGAQDTAVIKEFEASDVTLDANQGLAAHSSIAAGGVKVYGTHLLLNRVRVINAGTLTTSKRGTAIAVAGSFPDNPEPFDAVVEECIVDQVYPRSVREMSCIALASGERAADGFPAFHKGCVVRNCLIDCKYENLVYPTTQNVILDIPISQIVYSGGVATVTTKLAHGLSSNFWVVISGALVNSSSLNTYNGSYQITYVSATVFTYTPVAYGSLSLPAADPTGDMYIGRAQSQRVAIKGITFAMGVATLETWTPHNRVPGQNVVVNNVGGGSPIGGSFAITNVDSPTVLRFTSGGSGTQDVTNAWIGVDFYGITAGGGRGAIIEGNRILSTTFGLFRPYDNGASGTYLDSLSSKDIVIRDNYFYAVLVAVYEKLGQVSGGNSSQQPTRLGSTLNQNTALATFTTAAPHGFSVGSYITVTGASPAAYNGNFQVASVPTAYKFTYALASDPLANATGSIYCNGQAASSLIYDKSLATFTTTAAHGLAFGQAVMVASASPNDYNGIFPIASVPTPTSFNYIMGTIPSSSASGSFAFGALWQVGRLVIENNSIELVLTITTGIDVPTGIRLDRAASNPAAPSFPYTIGQAVLRGNVIRHVNNASDSSALPLAIQLNSCEAAIVEDNVINLDINKPIQFTACGSVKFFNNENPAGSLIQGYDAVKVQFVNELTTDADLSVILAT